MDIEEKLNNIEKLLIEITKKLNINTEKKPVNLIEKYGLKPLSFYEN
jgi:hypothetical protein